MAFASTVAVVLCLELCYRLASVSVDTNQAPLPGDWVYFCRITGEDASVTVSTTVSIPAPPVLPEHLSVSVMR